MPEQKQTPEIAGTKEYHVHYRYRGRVEQVIIYLGKLLRMLVYQNDWKVLPMSALIAGVVGMVIRDMFFRTMDGTLRAAFCLACVGVWNGCFNSIQSVCRERDVIKREHRSGMHISSYVFAHMLYQAALCLVQTGLTMYILKLLGISFPAEGLFTNWLIVDIGITLFLITYSADMLGLLISSLVHSTTTAMTVMPFMLIFQLVFAGGFFPLPAWGNIVSDFTITHYGLICLCAQGDVNNRPLTMVWNTLSSLSDNDIEIKLTVGQILDILTKDENPIISELRDRELNDELDPVKLWQELEQTEYWQELCERKIETDMTVGEMVGYLQDAESLKEFRESKVGVVTMGDVLETIAEALSSTGMDELTIKNETTVGDLVKLIRPEDILKKVKEAGSGQTVTVGEIIDIIADSRVAQDQSEKEITASAKVGDVINLIGRDKLRSRIIETTTAASQNPDYEMTKGNIISCWAQFVFFILVFAGLSILFLEFIDRDKR